MVELFLMLQHMLASLIFVIDFLKKMSGQKNLRRFDLEIQCLNTAEQASHFCDIHRFGAHATCTRLSTMVVIADGVVYESSPVNCAYSQAKFENRAAQFRECQTQYETARRWFYTFIQEPVAVHARRDQAFWQCMRDNNTKPVAPRNSE